MVGLDVLWLPILVSALVVLSANALMWMVLPHHRPDWKKLPGEDAVLDCLREQDVRPGQYTLPYFLPSQLREPEIQEKIRRGPMLMMVVEPTEPPPVARATVLSLLHNLIVSSLVGYLAASTLEAGASYLEVFRVAGTAAILGHAGSIALGAIWLSRTWSSILKEIADGVVYGLLTAGVFGWLWP